eukprot:356602-Chlamydomonas_euryale.AAC.4
MKLFLQLWLAGFSGSNSKRSRNRKQAWGSRQLYITACFNVLNILTPRQVRCPSPNVRHATSTPFEIANKIDFERHRGITLALP